MKTQSRATGKTLSVIFEWACVCGANGLEREITEFREARHGHSAGWNTQAVTHKHADGQYTPVVLESILEQQQSDARRPFSNSSQSAKPRANDQSARPLHKRVWLAVIKLYYYWLLLVTQIKSRRLLWWTSISSSDYQTAQSSGIEVSLIQG